MILRDLLAVHIIKKEKNMEFKDVVKNRYSCKSYDGRKVEQDKLDAILEAGRLAPTAKNLQEQHIYVLQSDEALAKVDKVTPCRYNAGTCLLVTFDKNNVYTYPNSDRESGVEDAAIVATHLMLAAADEGINSCWLNFIDLEKIHTEFSLPDNEEVLMILDLGYAAEGTGPLPNHGNRKPVSETVTYL